MRESIFIYYLALIKRAQERKKNNIGETLIFIQFKIYLKQKQKTLYRSIYQREYSESVRERKHILRVSVLLSRACEFIYENTTKITRSRKKKSRKIRLLSLFYFFTFFISFRYFHGRHFLLLRNPR